MGSGATAENMELNVQPDSRLSYEGTEGEVISISNNLQSGVIFAVKDISGLDQISVNASGDMHLAPYYGNVRVGATGVIHEDYALDVQGKGLRVGGSGTVLTRASAPAVTTDTLYNVGGSLYFDGSTVGGGSAAGAIHQIQYNDGSNFAGDSQFLFSKANAAFTNDRVFVMSGVIIANSGDANYANPVSIGSGAYVTCANAVVIGGEARSVGVTAGATAVGVASQAAGGSVAIGYGASSNTHNSSVAIGGSALANSEKCVAIGKAAQAADGGVSVGNGAGSGGGGPHSHAICIGEASSSASYTITMGGDSSTAEQFGMAIGYNSHSRGYRGVAYGPYASAGQHSVALGNGAIAPDGGFVLASGSALTDVLLSGVMKTHLTMPNSQQFIQMATAAQTTDLTQWQNSAGTNVAAMTPSGILNVYDIRTSGTTITLGKDTTNTGAEAIAIGNSANVANAKSVGVGGDVEIDGGFTVAIGHQAYALENYSVSIGYRARDYVGYSNTVSIGANAESAGGSSTAVGNTAVAGEGAVALGYSADAQSYSVSLGSNADAQSYGVALGVSSDANGYGSVAIGYDAVSQEKTWVIASGATAAAVGISGVFGSYVAIPNDQKLAVGSNVPEYPIDVVTHSGVIRASGVKGCISTNPDAATVTFDLNAATTHAVTLGGDRTLAVSNANVGDKFLIRLQQPTSSAGKTVTWFSHIKWAEGGTAPTLTATASKADLLGFLAASGDGGSNIWYDGFVVGQNI